MESFCVPEKYWMPRMSRAGSAAWSRTTSSTTEASMPNWLPLVSRRSTGTLAP